MNVEESAELPGSGALTERERELITRVHLHVTLDSATLMLKILYPDSLDRLLGSEISSGTESVPPFDYRMSGGYVVRAQDVATLADPVDLIRAFGLPLDSRLFDQGVRSLYVVEFAVVEPGLYVVPIGAPDVWDGDGRKGRRSIGYYQAVAGMLAAAETVGLPGGSYREEKNFWPFTGTGFTADPNVGCPLWNRAWSPLPTGAILYRYQEGGPRSAVAAYRGGFLGWKDLR